MLVDLRFLQLAVTARARKGQRFPVPRGPARTEACAPQLPRLCDECVTTFLFSTFSTARQGVGSRARTADRDARVPQPKPVGWLDANSLLKHHVAWHATLAALHR
jgi:hypothetical protein